MKVFEANRLSDGNKVMPNKISIDDFGVTLRIPGVFSGKEKTLTFHEISSVNIETPMVGFSTITFNTVGWDDLMAKGFSKEDAIEIKKLVQSGISSVRGGGSARTSKNVLAEAEAEKIRHQIEMEKKAVEAKEDREFFEAIIKYWKIWVPIVTILVGILLYSNMQKTNVIEEANKLNLKLEQVEDKIKIAIQDGDRDNALELTNQLVHPTHEVWEGKGGLFDKVYYDQYWLNKREGYKKQILESSKSNALKKSSHTKKKI